MAETVAGRHMAAFSGMEAAVFASKRPENGTGCCFRSGKPKKAGSGKGETNKSKEKPVSANRQPKKETVQKTAAVKVVYPVAVEKAPEENSVPVPEKKKKKKRYYYPRKPANTAKNSH